MAKFEGKLISRALVNNGATLNVLLASMLKKLGKKKSDMLLTDLIMTNFYGTKVQHLGVIFIKLTIGHRMIEVVLFVIDPTTTYNALLGLDWIHMSKCIPLSLHQYLIILQNDDFAKIVKANAKHFMVTSNMVDALLYTEDIGPITFFG